MDEATAVVTICSGCPLKHLLERLSRHTPAPHHPISPRLSGLGAPVASSSEASSWHPYHRRSCVVLLSRRTWASPASGGSREGPERRKDRATITPSGARHVLRHTITIVLTWVHARHATPGQDSRGFQPDCDAVMVGGNFNDDDVSGGA